MTDFDPRNPFVAPPSSDVFLRFFLKTFHSVIFHRYGSFILPV